MKALLDEIFNFGGTENGVSYDGWREEPQQKSLSSEEFAQKLEVESQLEMQTKTLSALDVSAGGALVAPPLFGRPIIRAKRNKPSIINVKAIKTERDALRRKICYDDQTGYRVKCPRVANITDKRPRKPLPTKAPTHVREGGIPPEERRVIIWTNKSKLLGINLGKEIPFRKSYQEMVGKLPKQSRYSFRHLLQIPAVAKTHENCDPDWLVLARQQASAFLKQFSDGLSDHTLEMLERIAG